MISLFFFSVNPFVILEQVVFQIDLEYIYKINQFVNLVLDSDWLNDEILHR